MFARYFVELPIPAGDVEHLLTRDPQTWLPGLAERANQRGDELLADVGFGERMRMARTVAVEVGEPFHMNATTLVPLRWTPASGTGLFPSLDADLEIAALGPERTQLAMSARYAPPFKAVGRVIDRVALRRIAEATLKDFLDGVGQALVTAHGG